MDKESHPEVKFAAFIAYGSYLRDQGQIARLADYLDKFNTFSDRPMYAHMEAQYHNHSGRGSDIEAALSASRKAVESEPSHKGIEHNRAAIVVDAIEEDRIDPDSDRGGELLEEAKRRLNRLVPQSDFPDHHETRARLLTIQNEFDQARRNVNEALRLTPASNRGQVVQYLSTKRLIDIKQSVHDLREDVEAELAELKDTQDIISNLQFRMLQFLGFFATLLAVIVTSVQVAVQLSASSAIRLILTLIGGQLVAFAALGYLVDMNTGESPTQTRWRDLLQSPPTIVLLIGFLIMTVGIFLTRL